MAQSNLVRVPTPAKLPTLSRKALSRADVLEALARDLRTLDAADPDGDARLTAVAELLLHEIDEAELSTPECNYLQRLGAFDGLAKAMRGA